MVDKETYDAIVRAIKKELRVQMGLVYTDLKEAKEERKALKQKFFDLQKKNRILEEEIRKRGDQSDYAV